MPSKIAGLDHLRALAITLVFLYHYRLFPHPDWVDTIGLFGWTGVDLFFVLSGYLIAGGIFREQKHGRFSCRQFYLKRFFRIMPAFWAVLTLYYLLPSFREWESLPPLWKMLSFTQNFGLDLRHQRTFSHAWSLCIEEQFYLLLPLALILLARVRAGRRGAWLLLAFCIAGFLLRLMSWTILIAPYAETEALGILWYKRMYYPTYNRLDGLLAGISIAAIYHYAPRLRAIMARHAGVLLLAGSLLIGAAYLLCADAPQSFSASVFGFPLIALAYGFIVASCALPEAYINRYSVALTSFIARLSYSIYLIHKAAIRLAQQAAARLGIDEGSTAAFLLSLLLVLLMAAILYYGIERPFLRWKERLLFTRRTKSGVTA